jgi:hypothetical protein
MTVEHAVLSPVLVTTRPSVKEPHEAQDCTLTHCEVLEPMMLAPQ